MFEGFANVWTIIGMSQDYKPGRLYPVRIAGERVVLFRDASGRLSALIDRCPHRGVALSLGQLQDGVIQCPFHGWCFDGEGRNCNVPWNPDAKREQLGAIALPVREIAGLAWIHTGPVADSEPVASPSLLKEGVTICGQSVRWQAHWTRVMENMLDSPHLPFVHASTIGRGLARYKDKRMDVSWSPNSYGAQLTNQVEGREAKGRLDYRYPNTMELFIDPPGRIFRLLAVCLPESDTHTVLSIFGIRSFMRSRIFDPLFKWSNRRVAREDQLVLESSDPLVVPAAAKEKSVRTDAPTLAFRKIYFERLANSKAKD